MNLSPLFHWSPSDRRASILRYGLKPGRPPTVGTVRTVGGAGSDDESQPPRFMLCLGTSPVEAWRLSGRIQRADDSGTPFDLWEVILGPSDEVHVHPLWGPTVYEVRVANRIPKSRVIYLATRKCGYGRI